MKEKEIINYLFELNVLKKIYHNGPQLAGVKEPDSVAGHTYRAAIIGFFLAEMEGSNSEKVATMLLFHDNPEARIGDHNMVAGRYIKRGETEKKVLEDQMKALPSSIAKKIDKYWNEQENKKTKLGIIARDADLIETALQAKEYIDLGYPLQSWIKNVKKHLKTKSGKKLMMNLEKTKFTDWWKNLKKV